MQLAIIGLALSALLALAARDVGRAGHASPAGLAGLRVLGAAGLAAMALAAFATGYPLAALVAATGAAPLLWGLAAPAARRRVSRPAAARGTPLVAEARHPAPAEERRAA